MQLERIVVGIDGSRHAAGAREWAIHLGERARRPARVVTAVGDGADG